MFVCAVPRSFFLGKNCPKIRRNHCYFINKKELYENWLAIWKRANEIRDWSEPPPEMHASSLVYWPTVCPFCHFISLFVRNARPHFFLLLFWSHTRFPPQKNPKNDIFLPLLPSSSSQRAENWKCGPGKREAKKSRSKTRTRKDLNPIQSHSQNTRYCIIILSVVC